MDESDCEVPTGRPSFNSSYHTEHIKLLNLGSVGMGPKCTIEAVWMEAETDVLVSRVAFQLRAVSVSSVYHVLLISVVKR